MNSMIHVSRLAALSLCGAALVACDSVKDVRESPTFAIPTDKVALTGEITGVGVGTTRPMEVRIVVTGDVPYNQDEDDETDDGNVIAPDGTRTTYQSLRGVRALNFGSVDIGASYEITVTRQPFGRICTPVQGASGTVTGPVTNIQIQCNRDSTPLYQVTATLAPAVANALPPGFAVSLTTEEGVEIVEPEAGDTSVTFDLPVFYPAADPPQFAYAVRATTTANVVTSNCAVTNGTGELATLGVGANGNITNVTVTGCQFGIAAVVSYSAPPGAPAGPPPAVGAGLTLGVKSPSGAILADSGVISAFSTTPVAFPGNWMSNASALYEVTVTSQPAGQFCAVDNGGLASLVAPASVTAQVRCRNIPAAPNRLTGTYQVVLSPDSGVDDDPETPDDPRPLASETERHFMTFFENGTFLYGIHHSVTAVGVEHGFYNYDSGAETLTFNIFTDANGGVGSSGGITVSTPVAGCGYSFSVAFPGSVGPPCAPGAVIGPPTVFPACGGGCTITAPAYIEVATSVAPVANVGLSGAGGDFTARMPFNAAAFPPNFGPGVAPLTASVTRIAAIPSAPPPSGLPGDPELPAIGQQLNLTFGSAVNWTMVAPVPNTTQTEIDNMEGSWVTADSKQVWVYDKSSLYGWHAGVNGAPNLQDVCVGVEKRPSPLGYDTLYARRVGSSDIFGGAVGCAPGGIAVVNVPLTSGTSTTVPVVPGFVGAMPGTSLNATVSPSPTYIRVTPGVGGAPDTLTIQATLNDTAVGEPLEFIRNSVN